LSVDLGAGTVEFGDGTSILGDLVVRAGTGDIRAVRADADVVELTTGGGNVSFAGSARRVTVSSAVGDIMVDAGSAGRWRSPGDAYGEMAARTGSGAVSVRVGDGGSGAIALSSGIGDISLSVPRAFSAGFTLRTDLGGIDANAALAIQPQSCKETSAGAVVVCQMGEGGRPVSLESGAGDITIQAIDG
jgi:DUF4097 and DUF4098 domain-containing protein YvlB